MVEGVAMALKPENQVILWQGDDTSLPWDERIKLYAAAEQMPIDLAEHLAAIERGFQETLP